MSWALGWACAIYAVLDAVRYAHRLRGWRRISRRFIKKSYPVLVSAKWVWVPFEDGS